MQKVNYENLTPESLGKEVKIKISKKAFKGPLHCPDCNIKMEKIITDMDLPENEVTLHLKAYKCPKCHRERLSGDQAERFDKLMLMMDIMKKNFLFKFERATNFDGKNWFIRFPIEITKTWNKKMIANITPLSQKDFFIHFKK